MANRIAYRMWTMLCNRRKSGATIALPRLRKRCRPRPLNALCRRIRLGPLLAHYEK